MRAEALSPHTHYMQFRANPPEQETDVTTVKVKQFVLVIFASLSLLFGGILLATGTLNGLIVSLPFFAASAYALWHLFPRAGSSQALELAAYKEQALTDSLFLTLETHGWQKIFQERILEPEAFRERFRKAAEEISFPILMHLCEEANEVLEKSGATDYEVPTPADFRQKFLDEVEDMQLCTILERYDIDALIDERLLPAGIQAIKKEYDRCKALLRENLERARELFYDQAKGPLEALRKAVSQSESTPQTQQIERILSSSNALELVLALEGSIAPLSATVRLAFGELAKEHRDYKAGLQEIEEAHKANLREINKQKLSYF